ncbi:hypothetical protein [Streptomyces sp. NPDC051662]|uniref:hypothetical protein n=1 Tax=Streptomyces sp. NPDC051662 TaxID=3154750 RepID=UPI00341FF1A6
MGVDQGRAVVEDRLEGVPHPVAEPDLQPGEALVVQWSAVTGAAGTDGRVPRPLRCATAGEGAGDLADAAGVKCLVADGQQTLLDGLGGVGGLARDDDAARGVPRGQFPGRRSGQPCTGRGPS